MAERLKEALNSLMSADTPPTRSDAGEAVKNDLCERLAYSAEMLRASVVGGEDDAAVAEWFNPIFLRGVAALIDQVTAALPALLADREDAERWRDLTAVTFDIEIQLSSGQYVYRRFSPNAEAAYRREGLAMFVDELRARSRSIDAARALQGDG